MGVGGDVALANWYNNPSFLFHILSILETVPGMHIDAFVYLHWGHNAELCMSLWLDTIFEFPKFSLQYLPTTYTWLQKRNINEWIKNEISLGPDYTHGDVLYMYSDSGSTLYNHVMVRGWMASGH